MRPLHFDQSEAWPRLEDAVRQTVAALPDFPGFETRSITEIGADPEWVAYELSYTFSLPDSETRAVRADYVTILKQQLPTVGYRIHGERFDQSGAPVAVQAIRDDGVNIWYRVLGLVSVKAQCGPVRRVPDFDPYCPHPLGGVSPDRDAALDYAKRGYTDDEPARTDPIDEVRPYEL